MEGRTVEGIVDSHVHLLPERLGTAIRAFFADHGVPTGSFAYPLDHSRMCADLAADGITTAWTLPYVRRPGAAAALNVATAAAAAAATTDGPVEVVAGCAVHPGDVDPAGIVGRAVGDLGARVLKLHCSVGDHLASDRRLDPVWESVGTLRLPVVVHVGHSVTGHTDADELEDVATVCRRWPEARVIVAHCGHHAAGRTLELMAQLPNLHADLTPVVFDLVAAPPEQARAVADRLLFGSDAPNTAIRAGDALRALDRLGLSPEQRAAVTGGTARRLTAAVAT